MEKFVKIADIVFSLFGFSMLLFLILLAFLDENIVALIISCTTLILCGMIRLYRFVIDRIELLEKKLTSNK